jgi:hypothetical protein
MRWVIIVEDSVQDTVVFIGKLVQLCMDIEGYMV